MANTFTFLGPSGVFPGLRQPVFPSFNSVGAHVPSPLTTPYIPLLPLPGITGAGSYAMQWLLATPFLLTFLAYALK